MSRIKKARLNPEGEKRFESAFERQQRSRRQELPEDGQAEYEQLSTTEEIDRLLDEIE